MADSKKKQNSSLFQRKRKGGKSKQALPSLHKILTIAHNHPDFFPGGGELLAHQLHRAFRADDSVESEFLAATDKLSREPHNGTPFLAHEGREDEFLFWVGRFDYFRQSQKELLGLYRDLRHFLLRSKPDIVHFHHTLRIGVEALQVVRDTLPDCKIVFTLHDFIPMCHRDGQMVENHTERLCDEATPVRCHQCFDQISAAHFAMREQFIKTHFSLVDAFVSPSRMLAERYIQWGIPEHKMHVIANGTPDVEPAEHRYVPRGESRNRFAFFGQITPYKGAHVLADAAALLAADEDVEEFRVDMYGNIAMQLPEFRDAFFARIDKAPEALSYHGAYRPEQLSKLMEEVDWVVVPSTWWENSPLVIAEALRHRRPVICGDIGGMAEQVPHEVNGLQFRAGDAHSLADTMKRAMDEKGLWDALVSRLKTPHDITQCAGDYMSLFESLTEGHAEGPHLYSAGKRKAA